MKLLCLLQISTRYLESLSFRKYALCLVHFGVGPIVGGCSKVGELEKKCSDCLSSPSNKTFLSLVILSREHQSPFLGPIYCQWYFSHTFKDITSSILAEKKTHLRLSWFNELKFEICSLQSWYLISLSGHDVIGNLKHCWNRRRNEVEQRLFSDQRIF